MVCRLWAIAKVFEVQNSLTVLKSSVRNVRTHSKRFMSTFGEWYGSGLVDRTNINTDMKTIRKCVS